MRSKNYTLTLYENGVIYCKGKGKIDEKKLLKLFESGKNFRIMNIRKENVTDKALMKFFKWYLEEADISLYDVLKKMIKKEVK